MIYYIQNKYQDSGWEYVDTGEPGPSSDLQATIAKADRMASQAMLYGMVRVIDENGGIHRTWGAGETSGSYAPPHDAYMTQAPERPVTAADIQRELFPQFSRSFFVNTQGQVCVSVATLDALLCEMQLNNLRQRGPNSHDALLQSLREFLLRVEQKAEGK